METARYSKTTHTASVSLADLAQAKYEDNYSKKYASYLKMDDSALLDLWYRDWEKEKWNTWTINALGDVMSEKNLLPNKE